MSHPKFNQIIVYIFFFLTRTTCMCQLNWLFRFMVSFVTHKTIKNAFYNIAAQKACDLVSADMNRLLDCIQI